MPFHDSSSFEKRLAFSHKDHLQMSCLEYQQKSPKGPKGKEDCAASIGGNTPLQKKPAGVPQKAAEG
jgi:hypothetical protein